VKALKEVSFTDNDNESSLQCFDTVGWATLRASGL